MAVPVLSVVGIRKTFCGEGEPCPALAGITFDVAGGEIVCIMGPSGCGKSTLLRIIGGLDHADAGSIDGVAGSGGGGASAAMIFQDHALFPWLTVEENIVYGLRLAAQNLPEDEVHLRAQELLSLIHLGSFAHSLPHQLSGGMKQRVSVARALAIRPSISAPARRPWPVFRPWVVRGQACLPASWRPGSAWPSRRAVQPLLVMPFAQLARALEESVALLLHDADLLIRQVAAKALAAEPSARAVAGTWTAASPPPRIRGCGKYHEADDYQNHHHTDMFRFHLGPPFDLMRYTIHAIEFSKACANQILAGENFVITIQDRFT